MVIIAGTHLQTQILKPPLDEMRSILVPFASDGSVIEDDGDFRQPAGYGVLLEPNFLVALRYESLPPDLERMLPPTLTVKCSDGHTILLYGESLVSRRFAWGELFAEGELVPVVGSINNVRYTPIARSRDPQSQIAQLPRAVSAEMWAISQGVAHYQWSLSWMDPEGRVPTFAPDSQPVTSPTTLEDLQLPEPREELSLSELIDQALREPHDKAIASFIEEVVEAPLTVESQTAPVQPPVAVEPTILDEPAIGRALQRVNRECLSDAGFVRAFMAARWGQKLPQDITRGFPCLIPGYRGRWVSFWKPKNRLDSVYMLSLGTENGRRVWMSLPALSYVSFCHEFHGTSGRWDELERWQVAFHTVLLPYLTGMCETDVPIHDVSDCPEFVRNVYRAVHYKFVVDSFINPGAASLVAELSERYLAGLFGFENPRDAYDGLKELERKGILRCRDRGNFERRRPAVWELLMP